MADAEIQNTSEFRASELPTDFESLVDDAAEAMRAAEDALREVADTDPEGETLCGLVAGGLGRSLNEARERLLQNKRMDQRKRLAVLAKQGS